MRNRKKTTSRGEVPLHVYKEAARLVQQGTSKSAAVKQFKSEGLTRTSLRRYITKCQAKGQENVSMGYGPGSRRIFSSKMEDDLAVHAVNLSSGFFGLSCLQMRKLAYNFAAVNEIDIPTSWRRDKAAGLDWLRLFMRRNKLSIRKPEATSLGRASAFNRHNLDLFYNNLSQLLQEHKYEGYQIYNADETGVSTVQNPGSVVAKKGSRQVGQITSAERGELVTVLCCINATGNSIPPMLIFPRKRYKSQFLRGAPLDSLGAVSDSGWINEELWLDFLKHFAKHTRSSPDNRVLLVIDNHKSHVTLDAVTFARENGIDILTLHPHTTHKMQPLDVAVYSSFKSFYNRGLSDWCSQNPGKTFSIYDVGEVVGRAYSLSLTPSNITSGFKKTGIFPFNRDAFSDEDFLGSDVTDRPNNSAEGQSYECNHINPKIVLSDGFGGDISSLDRYLQDASCTVHAQSSQTTEVRESELAVALCSPTRSSSPNEASLQLLVNPSLTLDASSSNNPPQEQSVILVGQSDASMDVTRNLADSEPKVQEQMNTSLSIPSTSYIAPTSILPIPKAGPRVAAVKKSKKGKTRILTSTPEKHKLQQIAEERALKKKKVLASKKQKNFKEKQGKQRKLKIQQHSTVKSSELAAKKKQIFEVAGSSSSSDDELIAREMEQNFEDHTSDDIDESDSDNLSMTGSACKNPDDLDPDVWHCCVCGENYQNSKPKETWVRCLCKGCAHCVGSAQKELNHLCNNWAHSLCTDNPRNFICVDCCN